MSPTVNTGPVPPLENGERWIPSPTGVPLSVSFPMVLKSAPPSGMGGDPPGAGANGFG